MWTLIWQEKSLTTQPPSSCAIWRVPGLYVYTRRCSDTQETLACQSQCIHASSTIELLWKMLHWYYQINEKTIKSLGEEDGEKYTNRQLYLFQVVTNFYTWLDIKGIIVKIVPISKITGYFNSHNLNLFYRQIKTNFTLIKSHRKFYYNRSERCIQ